MLGSDSAQYLVGKLQQTLEAWDHMLFFLHFITIHVFDTILICKVTTIAFHITTFNIFISIFLPTQVECHPNTTKFRPCPIPRHIINDVNYYMDVDVVG